MSKAKGTSRLLWALPVLLALACGGGEQSAPDQLAADQSATGKAVAGAVQDVAEMVEKAASADIDETWPFTHRQVEAMRITSRTENLKAESYTETVLEYARPDRTRDVTIIVEGPGAEPTVAERVLTSENSYLRIGGKIMEMPASQDTVALIDDALRLNTSLKRLESAHKGRQFMQELEGNEDLDGMQTMVYYQGDLDVFLESEQVKGYQRTWVGAEDGLVYKLVREAESPTAHQRSTMTYEYGDSVTIEIPQE